MDIFKILLFAITVSILSSILKQYKPEYSIQISVAAGVIIFISVSDSLKDIYLYIENLCDSAGIDKDYINVLFKVTGISYLCEFTSSICRDAGESAMALKVDIAGKITLIYLSLPIFKELLVVITEVAL